MIKYSTTLLPVFASSAFLLGIYACGMQTDDVKKTATPKASASPGAAGTKKATDAATDVVPFTFAEAKPICASCHGPTSGYHWDSAETEDGWIKKSANILGRLAKNDMPPNGGLADEPRKKMTAYVEALSKKVVTPTPTPLPTSVGTPTPAPPFTLTDAELRCKSCHASTATGGNSAQAKGKWMFTIGAVAGWTGVKSALTSEVQQNKMPPGGGLGTADKAKMLEFLNKL